MNKLPYLEPAEIKCHNRGRLIHPCENRAHPIEGAGGTPDIGAILQQKAGEIPKILAPDKNFIQFVDPQDFALQRNGIFDPWDCVSCAHQTAIYAVYKAITGQKFPLQSRRFTAIRSGTKLGEGTSNYAVEQSILDDGMIPEEKCVSMTPTMTAAEFFADVDLSLLTFEDFKKFFDVIFWQIPTRDGVSASRFNLIEGLLYTGIIVTVDGDYNFDPAGNIISAAQVGGQRPVTSDNHDVFLGFMSPNGVGSDEVIDSENSNGIVRFSPQYDYHYPTGVYLKKKSMYELIKEAGLPAVYLHLVELDEYYGISDSKSLQPSGQPLITGGDLLKTFSGTYNNAAIIHVPSFDHSKIKGLVSLEKS